MVTKLYTIKRKLFWISITYLLGGLLQLALGTIWLDRMSFGMSFGFFGSALTFLIMTNAVIEIIREELNKLFNKEE